MPDILRSRKHAVFFRDRYRYLGGELSILECQQPLYDCIFRTIFISYVCCVRERVAKTLIQLKTNKVIHSSRSELSSCRSFRITEKLLWQHRHVFLIQFISGLKISHPFFSSNSIVICCTRCHRHCKQHHDHEYHQQDPIQYFIAYPAHSRLLSAQAV